jgi:hypothetical protein
VATFFATPHFLQAQMSVSDVSSFMEGWRAGVESSRSKWVDVRVVDPAPNRLYLTFHPLLGFSLLVWTEGLCWKSGNGNLNELEGVSHWMELPEAPSE